MLTVIVVVIIIIIIIIIITHTIIIINITSIISFASKIFRRQGVALTPNLDHKNLLHNICSKGWAARAPFLKYVMLIFFKGWARYDVHLVMQTGSIPTNFTFPAEARTLLDEGGSSGREACAFPRMAFYVHLCHPPST